MRRTCSAPISLTVDLPLGCGGPCRRSPWSRVCRILKPYVSCRVYTWKPSCAYTRRHYVLLRGEVPFAGCCLGAVVCSQFVLLRVQLGQTRDSREIRKQCAIASPSAADASGATRGPTLRLLYRTGRRCHRCESRFADRITHPATSTPLPVTQTVFVCPTAPRQMICLHRRHGSPSRFCPSP